MNSSICRMGGRKLRNLSEAAACKVPDYFQSDVSENGDVNHGVTRKLTRSSSSRRFPAFKPKERLRRQLSAPIRRTTSTSDVTAESSGRSTTSTHKTSSSERKPSQRWGLLRHSLTSVRDKITNKRISDKKDPDSQLVKVEIPYINYSSSLMLTSLKNGCFTAELPLCDVPAGDLTLRVESGLVQLIITEDYGSFRRKGKHVSYVCGYLHLPIYVDPCSLQLGEEKEDRIQIICLMKGFTTATASTRRGALSRSKTSPGFSLFKSSKPKLRKHPSNINISVCTEK